MGEGWNRLKKRAASQVRLAALAVGFAELVIGGLTFSDANTEGRGSGTPDEAVAPHQ